MKTALAPTAKLATPKVEKFVIDKILPYLGPHAALKRFYLCEPPCSDVENRHGERWIEANYGAEIVCNSFSTNGLYDLQNMSQTIDVNEASVEAAPKNQVEVSFWLSARVMRW